MFVVSWSTVAAARVCIGWDPTRFAPRGPLQVQYLNTETGSYSSVLVIAEQIDGWDKKPKAPGNVLLAPSIFGGGGGFCQAAV